MKGTHFRRNSYRQKSSFQFQAADLGHVDVTKGKKDFVVSGFDEIKECLSVA
jgi:hypothetical protein